MLTGWTQTMLGADKHTIALYDNMTASSAWKSPLSYTKSSFTLKDFDLVFLPGGHDQGIRQLLDCPRAHALLVDFFPLTRRDAVGKPKYCGAICHGVQLLAHSRNASGVSVLQDVATTTLPAFFESSVHNATRLVLGDYYKTYGAGTESVEAIVRSSLKDDTAQFKGSINAASPFVVEDQRYRYFSGRWPGDAQVLADKIVKAVDARN
jgi:putative intracellular protease/amidase